MSPFSGLLCILFITTKCLSVIAWKTDNCMTPPLTLCSIFSFPKTLKNNLPDTFQQLRYCQVSPAPPRPSKSLIKENENVNFGKPALRFTSRSMPPRPPCHPSPSCWNLSGPGFESRAFPAALAGCGLEEQSGSPALRPL